MAVTAMLGMGIITTGAVIMAPARYPGHYYGNGYYHRHHHWQDDD
jgi:hypothetical protein